MRELLFRGFHSCGGPDTIVVDGEKVKGRWVEGYYVERDNKSWIYPASNQIISKSLARELRPFHSAKSTQKIMKEVFPVLPSSVGQYTGLTDKNGKRIFEGDIISWPDWRNDQRKAPVRYDDEWKRFCVWLNGAESMGVNKHLSTGGIEVIGTVFDEEAANET